jgi:hypothetical protein
VNSGAERHGESISRAARIVVKFMDSSVRRLKQVGGYKTKSSKTAT